MFLLSLNFSFVVVDIPFCNTFIMTEVLISNTKSQCEQ